MHITTAKNAISDDSDDRKDAYALDFLADSLSQVMQETKDHCSACRDREDQPHVALREALLRPPENFPLRPRRRDAVNSRDLDPDDGAFLQSNVASILPSTFGECIGL